MANANIEEILAAAGISRDQYRVREDVEYWWREEGGFLEESPDGFGLRGRPLVRHAMLAHKAPDGVWEIGRAGLANPFTGRKYPRAEWASSVLSEMGVTDEVVESLRERFGGLRW